MGLIEANDPRVLRAYEGLIFRTAQLVVADRPELDADDVQQVLWIKTYRALIAFDPTRCRSRAPSRRCPTCHPRCGRCKYVFMCVQDQVKDLLKRKRPTDVFIEDVAPTRLLDGEAGDRFELRYQSTSPEQVYGPIEDDDLLLPSTLTQLELDVVGLLYRGYRQIEIATFLDLDRREMERAMKQIRLKMADWRPSPAKQPEPLAAAA